MESIACQTGLFYKNPEKMMGSLAHYFDYEAFGRACSIGTTQ
ncbi:MAG: antirestriction protein ArdA [Muribaculaceae bacterium]|nr:antirestriction protein ArdA [Muribaculaceae bacterium]